MTRLLFLLGCLLAALTARAQAPLTAGAAYDYLQAQRARARTAVGKAEQPPVDSLRRGVRILQAALAYYYRPDVVSLAKTSKYLYARKDDIRYDLAVLQGRLHEPATAAATLQQILTPEQQGIYAAWITREPALAEACREPALQPLLARNVSLNNVFNSKALDTPYQSNLSATEKVAGLSKLWAEAKYNFAFFDHLPNFDWDQLYLDYLPRVQATPSTATYLRVLEEFYAQLHDGHTGVWAGVAPLADSLYRRPPIQAHLVEGRVLVRQVRSDSLLRTGLVPGLEIVGIDGQPAVAYATRYVRPYVSGSTPQNLDVQTYIYGLLSGPITRPVRLELRDAKGRTFTRVLPQRGYGKQTPYVRTRLHFLPGNVAYLQVNEFETDAGFKRFVAAFDSIKTTRALIIDCARTAGAAPKTGSTS